MISKIFIACASALLCVAAAPATEPADVGSLVANLDNDQFSVRQSAEQALDAMGPGIEPQLRDALKQSLSDEARARIQHLLDNFDETKALHALITMHYKDAPLSQVLNDLAGQCGGDLDVRDPMLSTQTRSLSIDLDNSDFWRALKAVCEGGGVVPQIRGNSSELFLMPADARLGKPFNPVTFFSNHSRISGGLLISPQRCGDSSTYDYGQDRSVRSPIALQIYVFAEPKMSVIGELNTDWLKQCEDEKGHSLALAGQAQPFFFNNMRARQTWWQLNVNLTPTPDMGEKIAVLRGEFDFFVQTKSENFEIDNITQVQNVSKTDGDLTVMIHSFQKTPPTYRLDISLQGPAVRTGDPMVNDLMTSMEVLDDAGQPLRRQMIRPTASAGGLDMSLFFFAIGNSQPTKLVWRRTLEKRRVSVPFELDDLPLPPRG
jgi:hypothetical protein